MWKKLQVEDKTYIIRISVEENGHKIMLSDFSKLWVELLNEEVMLLRCKELNPLFEAEPDVLVKSIKGLIEPNKHNVKKDIIEVGNQLTLRFSSYLNGILFRFQFILTLTSSEKLYQDLTFPLIQIIEELQARQKGLCDLLIKKDVEINEYKMEGAKLTRKNVITEPFNKEKFLERCLSDDSEKRSAINLSCPYSFFEESCSKLYEECTKRKKVIECALSPKKNHGEGSKEEVQRKEKPETTKRKKINELMYVDKEDETDDDETYFSASQAKVTKKPEIKSSVKSKKKKLLNL